MDLFDVAAKIKLDTSDYEKDLAGAEKSGSAFANKLKNGLSTAAKVGGAAIAAIGAGVVALGKKFVDGMRDVAAYGDEVDKMSQKLGLSKTAYQEWDYVLGQAGVEITSMSTGLKTLTNKLDEAKNGSEDAQKMFAALGLSMEDLSTMSREDVFASVITGFQGMADSTERAALANDLFGRSGQELTPLFNSSIEDTNELRQAAHDLGFVLSDEAVSASADFNDALDTLTRTVGGLKNQFIQNFLPAATKVMDGLTAIFGGDSEGGVEQINAGITDIVNKLSEKIPEFLRIGFQIVQGLTNAIAENLPTLIESGADLLLNGVIPGLLDNAPTLISTFIGIISTLATEIGNAIPDLVNSFVEAVPLIVDGLVSALPELVQGAITLFMGILDAIPAVIKAIVPQIPKIINAVIQALRKGLPDIINGAVELLMGIVEAIPVIIDELLKELPDIIQSLIDGLMEAFPLILDGAIQVFMAIVDAIPVIIQSLTENLPRIIDTIIDGLLGAIPMLLDGAITLLMAIIDALPTIISVLVEEIPRLVTTIVNTLLDHLPELIEGAFQLLMGIVSAIPQIITELVKNVPQIIKSIVDSLGNGFKDILGVGRKLISKLWEGITTTFENIKTWGKNIFAKIGEGISNAWTTVKNWGISVISKIWEGIKNTWENVKNWGQNIFNKIGEGISNAWETVKNWGKDLIKNFWDGIKSKLDWFWQQIKSVGQGIKDFLGFSEPKKGPLSNFHTFAPDMMNLFMKGIEDNKQKLASTVEDAFDFGSLIEGGYKYGVNADVNYKYNGIGKSEINRPIYLVLDTGELVGRTVDKYDEALGSENAMQLRWEGAK